MSVQGSPSLSLSTSQLVASGPAYTGNPSSSSSGSLGEVIGVGVGCFVVGALLVSLLVIVIRRRHRKELAAMVRVSTKPLCVTVIGCLVIHWYAQGAPSGSPAGKKGGSVNIEGAFVVGNPLNSVTKQAISSPPKPDALLAAEDGSAAGTVGPVSSTMDAMSMYANPLMSMKRKGPSGRIEYAPVVVGNMKRSQGFNSDGKETAPP